MQNHRNSDVAKIWDTILAATPEPLVCLKGKRGATTALYKRLFKKKGLYVVRDTQGDVVYVGIAGIGEKEGALADRLWTHSLPSSTLSRRLAQLGIAVSDCSVTIHEEADARKRRRAEKYGIAVFDPPGNDD